MNPNNPAEIAEMFSTERSENSYILDFSLQSLEVEINRFLETEDIGKDNRSNACKLEAYIGESLCRIFNGNWTGYYFGHDDPRNAVNFFID